MNPILTKKQTKKKQYIAIFNCFSLIEPAVTQDEQQWTSVSPRLAVRRRPAPRCYRGHALPEVFSCWADHVNPCVPRHHHPQISGICLHKLPATS